MEVTGRGHGHGGAGQRAAARSADSAPSASSYPGQWVCSGHRLAASCLGSLGGRRVAHETLHPVEEH